MCCIICSKKCEEKGCTCTSALVLTGALLICLVVDGCIYNIGILISYWVTEFNVTRFQVDWIGSIQLFFTYCLGPLTGVLIRKFGISAVSITGGILAALGLVLSAAINNLIALYICFGCLSGCGYGMLYLSAIVSITTGFDELRPIAMGVMACGSGIGASIMSLLIPVLERKFNWRGACILISGMLLNCCVFGALLNLSRIQRERDSKEKPMLKRSSSSFQNNLGFLGSGYLQLPNELGGNAFSFASQYDLKAALATPKLQNMMGSLGSFTYLVEVEKLVQREGLFGKGQPLWKNTSFLIFIVAEFFQAFGSLSAVILLYGKLVSFKIDESMASCIISICGVSNAISRLFFGTISTISRTDKILMLGGVLVSCGVVHISSVFCQHIAYLYFYTCCLGFCLGGMTVLHPLVLADIVQVERLTEAMGIEIMAIGLGYTFGTPVATLINQYFGSYHASYIWSSILLITGGIGILIIRRKRSSFSDNEVERLRQRLEAALG